MTTAETEENGQVALPEGVRLAPYQHAWIADRSQLKIWLASRQVGKSFAISLEAVNEAVRKKCDNLILSSSERQSQEVMRKVYTHLGLFDVRSAGVLAAERETREEVELPNGSRIISLPANPDTVRGFSGNVFLDEFAFHRDSESIWRAMYPTVTRGYGIRITSTPNGKLNMFYRLWTGDPRFSRHRVNIYDAVREGFEADIEALRAGLADPGSWAQEYECEFVDEATAYLTLDMIASCEHPGATREMLLDDVIPASEARRESVLKKDSGQAGMTNREMYLGVDVGRTRDLTVFWLLVRAGDVLWTRMVREMRGAAFSLQRDCLYSLMEGAAFTPTLALPRQGGGNKLNSPPLAGGVGGGGIIRRCSIDASGIGAQLAEEAAQRFGPRVEPVAFTSSVKEDLAVTVRRRFEERTIRIPRDREIREDLHSVQRALTSAGNVRFDASRGGGSHADRFWALALALHAANTPRTEVRYEPLRHRERAAGRGCW